MARLRWGRKSYLGPSTAQTRGRITRYRRYKDREEPAIGDRIGAVLQHPLEVFRTNGPPDSNTQTVVETDETGSEKYSRGSASFAVVANQVRFIGAFGTVAHGDGFE